MTPFSVLSSLGLHLLCILHFPSHDNLCVEYFSLIHVDVWGPYSVNTHDGYKFFLTIVDDASRST